jgi:hypothetical protein
MIGSFVRAIAFHYRDCDGFPATAEAMRSTFGVLCKGEDGITYADLTTGQIPDELYAPAHT